MRTQDAAEPPSRRRSLDLEPYIAAFGAGVLWPTEGRLVGYQFGLAHREGEDPSIVRLQLEFDWLGSTITVLTVRDTLHDSEIWGRAALLRGVHHPAHFDGVLRAAGGVTASVDGETVTGEVKRVPDYRVLHIRADRLSSYVFLPQAIAMMPDFETKGGTVELEESPEP